MWQNCERLSLIHSQTQPQQDTYKLFEFFKSKKLYIDNIYKCQKLSKKWFMKIAQTARSQQLKVITVASLAQNKGKYYM